LSLGHARDYHGSNRVSILNVVILGACPRNGCNANFPQAHRNKIGS
jgi:hypothetical protein